MKISKVIFIPLVLISAGLTACSSDDSSPTQAVSKQSGENQELYDASKRPMEKAREVEKTIMDKADKDRKAMDGGEHDDHH